MSRVAPSRRTPVLVPAFIALLALGAAACGSDDESSTAPNAPVSSASDVTTASSAPSSPSSDAPHSTPPTSGPVTIEHGYGETVVPSAPQRIVSLDTQWTDVLLALDAPLVGYALDPYLEGGGTFPWQAGLLDDATSIAADVGSIPFEQVAALQPDLIVVTYYVQDESEYERLSQIAPTIPLLTDTEQVDSWQALAGVAGRVLGVEDRAATLVTDAEQRSADVLAKLPGLQGKTFALANYVPGDALYVVADPEDGSSVFFSQLGLSIDPRILEVADGVSGRATLSLEQVGLLDSDLLVMFTNGADPSEVAGFANLQAVQSGAVSTLDYAAVVGLNTPTPLSIPYSLDLIRPALEAAAGES